MELDKTGLNDRAFEAFARTSDREYFYLCNMQTDVSRWSRNAVERFGLPGEYLHAAGAVWEQHIHPDDRPLYVADIEAVFEGRKLRHDLLYRAWDRHGDYVTCSCRGVVLKGEGAEPDLFAGMITNHGIVENVDPVTGLCNGYEFLRALRASMRSRQHQLVLLVGVNEFGNVNQIHGYPFGNRLLRAFGERLADEVRASAWPTAWTGRSSLSSCPTQTRRRRPSCTRACRESPVPTWPWTALSCRWACRAARWWCAISAETSMLHR